MVQRGGGGLVNFFKSREQYPGIGINWICFDGGGHEAMPKSGYIIDSYTRTYKDSNAPRNRLFKSVVQPVQAKYFTNAHRCLHKRFQKTVDENGLPLKMVGYKVSVKANSSSLIRINHYYTKSKEEYLTKISVRLNAKWGRYKYNEESWAFPEWQLDDSMKEAAAALRERGVPETYGD